MKIRNKVIISVFNNQEVLLAQGYDPVRDFKFYIPVGGGVEFGEKLYDAAKRELFEELGIKTKHLEFVNFHECFFSFNGIPEHEIIYHYICHIDGERRKTLPSEGVESNGECFRIDWFSKSTLETIKESIVPPEIFEEIKRNLSKTNRIS